MRRRGGGGGRERSGGGGGGGGGEVRSTTQAAVGVVLCWCVGVEGSVAAAAALCTCGVWTCGGRKRSKNWVIQQCFSSFGIYLCSISLSFGFWGGGLGKRWPSFGDQLPPDEDVSTSKACGTVDSLIKIEFKSKFSPEITVEKDESVAEILFLKVKEVTYLFNIQCSLSARYYSLYFFVPSSLFSTNSFSFSSIVSLKSIFKA